MMYPLLLGPEGMKFGQVWRDAVPVDGVIHVDGPARVFSVDGTPTVEIWLIRAQGWTLDRARGYLECRLLSKEEKDRVDRFRFLPDKVLYLAAHATLRAVLSRKTGVRPEKLLFAEGEYGKPFLSDHEEIHFNLSHSGDAALIAVSDVEVGIDIEKENVEYFSQCLTATRGLFSEQEREWIRAGNERERFFRCWCAHEAVLKALGVGLTGPDRGGAIVPACSGSGSRLEACNSHLGLSELIPALGYRAAVALFLGGKQSNLT